MIALANKDTEYLGYEGVEQGVAPHVNYNPSKTTGTARKAELAERAKQAGVTKKTTPIISNSSSQQPVSVSTPQVTNFKPVSGTSAETIVYQTLKQNGYSDEGIAAVMGNMEQECHFNLSEVGDGGNSKGLCQWNDAAAAGHRWTKLVNWCKNNGYDPNTAKGQAEYLSHELEQDYPSLNSKLKNGGNYKDLAREFCINFERPDKKYQRANERAEYATKYYENIKNQTPVKT